MNRIMAKRGVAVFVFLCVACLYVDSVWAHRVNVFAWVEGDTVYVEGKFAGGKKVKAGKVLVMGPQGEELLSGLTNDQGEFSFRAPKQTDLKIVLMAGPGHQGEWSIRASELEGVPTEADSKTGPEKTVQLQEEKTVPKTSVDAGKPATYSDIKPEELEAAIETVLDRKLKPIIRMLTDIRQEGPTAKDIIAGIGYIVGLVGIGAYVRSRKKKE